MKTYSVILCLVIISIFSCKKETKPDVHTHTANAISGDAIKNFKPFPWNPKWYSNDLNKVFIGRIKMKGDGC